MIRRKLLYLSLFFMLWLSAAAMAQGSAFTYQGRLTDAGNPADGLYDIRFKLFDTPDVDTGTQQGPTVTHPTRIRRRDSQRHSVKTNMPVHNPGASLRIAVDKG